MKNITSIKLNKEFKRAYFQGRYKPHPFIISYAVRNYVGHNRVGITTSKKIGKAFQRNRARRIIRAAYLNVKDDIKFPFSCDIVFVAREKTTQIKSTELEPIIARQLSFLSTEITKKRINPKKKQSK